MKKNRTPALTLSRETLRRLDTLPFRAVAGDDDRPTATQTLPCRSVATVAVSCSGFASVCNSTTITEPEKSCTCG